LRITAFAQVNLHVLARAFEAGFRAEVQVCVFGCGCGWGVVPKFDVSYTSNEECSSIRGLAPKMDGRQGESGSADGGEKKGKFHDGLN
jgi:hypothetical protein